MIQPDVTNKIMTLLKKSKHVKFLSQKGFEDIANEINELLQPLIEKENQRPSRIGSTEIFVPKPKKKSANKPVVMTTEMSEKGDSHYQRWSGKKIKPKS